MRARDETSDAPMMRAFARGEAGAAEELYERYAPRIYGLGMVMLGNDASAQDLVQDTFVKLLRNADRYDPVRGKLDTWVLLVARSLAIDGIRRRVLDVRTAEAAAPIREISSESTPEEIAETMDMADRAKRAMTVLSDGQRAALELAYFGGKTSAEVAELEGIPLGTAKTRIRTALLRLREALEEHRDA
jgi:RNA polymerase sigma-70 factor (ECF subfamily)